MGQLSTDALQSILAAKPGATAHAHVVGALIFKVMGKMFAILSTRKREAVNLKCDPHLVEILKEKYQGVGHYGHLDHRFWIDVRLDADVPADEIVHLMQRSYELVAAGLTRKQQAELAALPSPKPARRAPRKAAPKKATAKSPRRPATRR